LGSCSGVVLTFPVLSVPFLTGTHVYMPGHAQMYVVEHAVFLSKQRRTRTLSLSLSIIDVTCWQYGSNVVVDVL